jgi:hypothetical protein
VVPRDIDPLSVAARARRLAYHPELDLVRLRIVAVVAGQPTRDVDLSTGEAVWDRRPGLGVDESQSGVPPWVERSINRAGGSLIAVM